MPKFEVLSQNEAAMKFTTGKRALVLREYVEYIERLQPGQAGKLQPVAGESIAAVRRRLGAASRMAGRQLAIRRAGEEVYFWAQEPVSRRRGRPPKSATT